jgi:D-threo-aldose 1-dehydrogenase
VLANPAIATVLIGPRSVGELDANLTAASLPIPDALWSALEDDGLVPRGSPRPPARGGAGGFLTGHPSE